MTKMQSDNKEYIELIKLRSEALDTRHLKLATWGTKEQLIAVLRNGDHDPYHTDQKWMNLMMDREYPKIDTLYNRDDRHFVISGQLRRREFDIIKGWYLTEKIHGRNTRVTLFNNGEVEYGGKTDDAEIPPELLEYLRRTFPPELLKAALWLPGKELPTVATIYGEGYGPKMMPGSGKYRKDVSFRLFDCLIEGMNGSWWLERSGIEDIARKLGIKAVPIIGYIDRFPETAQDLFNILCESVVAREESGTYALPEGVVARTDPLVYDKKGNMIIWKLKMKDFKKITDEKEV